MEAILGIAIFIVAVIQIMMVVKFFEIASDMKDVRNMLAKALQTKNTAQPTGDNPTEKRVESARKEESPKITWQSWVALAVIAGALILYLVGG